MYCLYPQQYKSKRVHVSKYTHFSDYWLRTSAVINVYKARARRNGTGCLFQFTYCETASSLRVMLGLTMLSLIKDPNFGLLQGMGN